MVGSIRKAFTDTVGDVLELVDQLILSGPLRPDRDARWPKLREAHFICTAALAEFMKPAPKYELPKPWEPLYLEQLQWGIFQAEGLHAEPEALFPTKERAEKYLEHMTTGVSEDDRWQPFDWCIMPCVVHGITFNDYNDEKVEFHEAERIFWNWVESE